MLLLPRGAHFPGGARLLTHTLTVARLGEKIAGTAVVAKTAASAVLTVPPTARLNGAVMLHAQTLIGWWNLEAKQAPFCAVARPPAPAQDGKVVFLAQPFPIRRHFGGSIAFAAARGSMACPPITGADGPAVNLAKVLLGRWCAFPGSFFGAHLLSIT